ncbi:hypothetical protein BDQ94DRAFT_32908 [Aspergillus welwitschiae]|uniref:HNH nuclease domain-containing protein n=1 Tax=Aspergillus welwitschiae TaxID=1341132 RepID=A0A3F3PH42_9EURO|nr:hypothetical protein BDQ94DRAFT_32908 [Aspergillus welwitschiae]RDH26261.1 hypothetical protein BDQ94DRAFT_32908 [Aspergillus welwitschiae]
MIDCNAVVSGAATELYSATKISKPKLALQTALSDSEEPREVKSSPMDSPFSTPINTPNKNKRPAASIESPVPSKRLRRDEAARKICKQRDVSCVITQTPGDYCDVAHVYPFSLRDITVESTKFFWSNMKRFWSDERVKKWKDAVFSGEMGTEEPENMMLLNPLAHRLHTKGLFALEPVSMSDDQTRLTLRIWWLKQQQPNKAITLGNIPDLPGDYNPEGAGICLYNSIRQQCLRSGEHIHLITPDPILLPLPDTTIMEMQWILQRVTALSGAAEPQELEEDDDDEGEDDFGLRPISPPLHMPSSSQVYESQSSPASSVSQNVRGGMKYSLYTARSMTSNAEIEGMGQD